jgi:hypothetical protein
MTVSFNPIAPSLGTSVDALLSSDSKTIACEFPRALTNENFDLADEANTDDH